MKKITEFETYIICDEFKKVSEIKILDITPTSFRFKNINENNQDIIINKDDFYKKYEILNARLVSDGVSLTLSSRLEKPIVIKPTLFLELNKTYLICDEFKKVSEIKILNITDTCYKIVKPPIISSFGDFDFDEDWILKTEFFKKYEILEEIKNNSPILVNETN